MSLQAIRKYLEPRHSRLKMVLSFHCYTQVSSYQGSTTGSTQVQAKLLLKKPSKFSLRSQNFVRRK